MKTPSPVVRGLLVLVAAIGLPAQENRDAAKAPASFSLNATAPHSGKVTYNQKYRYVLKHRLRKTKAGDTLRFVYLPVPPSDDYQEISHVDTHGGELFDNPGSRQKYVRYTITNPDPKTWAEVTLEFDYVPKGTEFVPAVVKDVVPYDTAAGLYKEYTSGRHGYIDTSNATLRNASDTLWSRSANAYDYARRCFEYVTDTFEFKDVGSGWRTTSDLIARNGGDCGNLSSLFITLLRCKRTPARHVIVPGHAWAEFYLEKYGWIPADPTFKLFGRASRSYERLVWSHEIVFALKTSDKDSFQTTALCQGHVLYPSHDPYECDQETTLREIGR